MAPPNFISDEEIGNFISDEEMAALEAKQSSSPDSGILGAISGASEGYLKGLPQVVTRPADLLVRGGLNALEGLGITDPTTPEERAPFMPTNIWKSSVDAVLPPDRLRNGTAEAVGEVVGTLPGFVAQAPTILPRVAAATKGMSMLPRAIEMGSAAGAEGAVLGAAFGAADTEKPLATSALQGGLTNMALGLAGPLVSEVSAGMSSGLNNARDRFTEKSIGAGVKDFAASRRMSGMDLNDNGALETKLNEAIRWTRDEGIFPAMRGGPQTVSSVANHKNLYGQQIGSIMQELDAVGPARGITPKLSLNNTSQFLSTTQKNPGISDDVAAQVKVFTDKLSNNWNGSAEGLFEFKKTLGDLTWSKPGGQPLPLDKRITEALYKDITETLQNTAQEAINAGVMGPEKLQQLLRANKAFSNLSQVQDVVDSAALSLQQQKIHPLKRAFWTTGPGAFGGTMAAGYALGNLPGAVAAGAAGVLSQTRAGQAAGAQIARLGASSFDLLEQIANNPYSVQGVSLAAMPRDWDRVKNDESVLAAIGQKIGLTPEDFVSLPEPIQKNIHAQIIASDPASAEPVPGNFAVANGEYLDPMEKDYVVSQALDLPASDRARIVGSSFQNKFSPLNSTPIPQPSTPIPQDRTAQVLGTQLPDPTYDGSQGSNLDQLNAAINMHSNDWIKPNWEH